MKQILVVTDTIDVNAGSGPKANMAIIDNLLDCGYKVHVIHYSAGDNINPSFSHTKINPRKWSPLYIIGVITRLLFRYTKINLNKWIEPVLGFSTEYFSTCEAFRRAIKNYSEPVDLIITLSKGASFRPHYAMLSCVHLHAKWLAYVHDPYPFHYYPRPYNWIQPGYQQKEKFFNLMADKAMWFAFPSRLLLEWMGSYFPKMAEKGVIIPHQISDVKPERVDTTTIFNKKKFNLLHAGNLMKQRPANGLIEGFKDFINENPSSGFEVELHLIGPADYHKATLEEYARHIPQLKINLYGVNYATAYWLQQAADVNIILESKSEISPFLPGKFPHCIEADKPILLLSPYYSESRRLLGNEYPYWCESDDTHSIAKKMESLYLIWKQSNSLKLNRSDLKNYSSANHLKEIIDQLS
jgi:hypothetical protein